MGLLLFREHSLIGVSLLVILSIVNTVRPRCQQKYQINNQQSKTAWVELDRRVSQCLHLNKFPKPPPMFDKDFVMPSVVMLLSLGSLAL